MNGIRRDDYFTSYVVFDLETTGLSRKDEIIEIGAIKVVDGNEVSSFAELVKPEYPIPPFATIISGITNEMVADARKITDVLADFLMFIDGFVLVGHNIASFDIPFIKRVAKEKLSVEIEHDYVDTRYYAQYRVAGLENYQLGTICKCFDIDNSDAHRALADCRMNRECYERLSKIEAKGYLSKGKAPSEKQFGTEFNKTTIALQTLHVLLLDVIADRVLEEKEVIILKDWLATNDDLKGNYPYDRVFNVIEKSVEDGILVQDELDEMLDLFTEYTNPVKKEIRSYDITKISGKLVCLTGEFKYGQKSEVTTLLEERGAICKDNVTSRTDILIVGGQGSASWKCGTYGGKIKKAMEMKEKGFSIQIYDENEVVSKCIPQI